MDDKENNQPICSRFTAETRAPNKSSLNTNSSESNLKNHAKNPNDKLGLSRESENQPLLGGFAILRAVQLLNLDIYYIGLSFKVNEAARLNRLGDVGGASKVQQSAVEDGRRADIFGRDQAPSTYYRTFLDELAEYNPLQKYIDRSWLLDAFCRFAKICLALLAIMIAFDKTFSTIILCFTAKIEKSESSPSSTGNTRMGLFVLILINLSSMYILFSTVFNGHHLWNLLSQRLFFVDKRTQIRAMLNMLMFIYLWYIVNILLINNLYEWDFISNNIQSESYSVLANLRVFVTEQDEDHYYVDTFLTIVQFSRGIIYISPYITINYVLICLKRHIHTIRNQNLLTTTLKKRQKFRLVVSNKRDDAKSRNSKSDGQPGSMKKKKVIFLTDGSRSNTNLEATLKRRNQVNGFARGGANNCGTGSSSNSISGGSDRRESSMTSAICRSVSSVDLDNGSRNGLTRNQSMEYTANSSVSSSIVGRNSIVSQRYMTHRACDQSLFLNKIRNFEELESYITNLYIFTGSLNRIMSKQGLTAFFIVHNLIISVSVIMPESIHGGFAMVYLVRFLVIMIGIVPFVIGQALNAQLAQLSKQIDRIIIQQQFIDRKRDNLVRIRELVHDIRINCGGMLNFNVETGVKYLVLAFASAFFIEQEHYKLTRRH